MIKIDLIMIFYLQWGIYMFQNNKYPFLFCFLISTALFICGAFPSCGKAASDEEKRPLVVVLDPGHGTSGSGASAYHDGTEVCEETLNLTIARYLKEELETYEDVTVILTRDGVYDVDLEERTMLGVEKKADVLISLHNNAKGEFTLYDHGCTVLAARGQYKEELAKKEQELGVSILRELSALGLEDQGILLRDSTNGEVYPNGEVGDYYAIIRNGIKNDLLSVLIEHAFVDNASDYEQFLSSEEKLHELALADARGIAGYFRLKKADTKEELPELKNVTEKLLYVKDEDVSHNELLIETFFVTKEPEEKNTELQVAVEEAEKNTALQAVGEPAEKNTSVKIREDVKLKQKRTVVLGVAVLLVLCVSGIRFFFQYMRKRRR